MLIRDVLRKKDRALITIRPTSSVAHAVSLLDEHNIGSLPVVDDRGRLCGIFSERDVLRGIRRLGEDFCRERIAAVMTRDVFSCTLDDSVHEAIGRMSTVGVGQLPVVDEGEALGLVSAGDLLRVLHAEAEEENRHLHAYVQGVH